MGVVVGVDIGSITAKAVVLDADGELLSARVVYEGIVNEAAGRACFDAALEEAGREARDVDYVVTTGYGRDLVRFGDRSVTEISCHAAGLHRLLPTVRTVLDIGGQDSKAIALDERGVVLNFRMNDRCAAGTGRFLEVMARAMGIELKEIGPLAMRSTSPAKVSSTCAVFAESEMVSLSAQGREKRDIVAGMHEAICRRLAAMVASVGMVSPMAMTGGVAKNPAMVSMLGRMLGTEIVTPPDPQIVGALGAASFALTTRRGSASAVVEPRVAKADRRVVHAASRPDAAAACEACLPPARAD